MQRTREEKIASLKAGAGSMVLFSLSIACFIIFLWVLSALVRIIVGLGAS